MQINEKNIEKIIDISELTKLMQFLAKNHEKKGGGVGQGPTSSEIFIRKHPIL